MNTQDDKHAGLPRPGIRRRAAIQLSQESLVTSAPLLPSQRVPLAFRPATDGVDLITWCSKNIEQIQARLLSDGALLFRDFQMKDIAGFEKIIHLIGGELLEYSYRSTPRSKVEGNIYTSTDYPASQHIPMHNEMSYSHQWPMKIGFYCLKAAEEGGETPIANSQQVFQRLDPAIREKFVQKNVMYVRNYGEGLDIPWQEVFQTKEKAEVEDFCRKSGIEFEWKSNDGLKTRQVCQAVATHPVTQQVVWYNQAHLFHVSSLPEDVRKTLESTRAEEDLPRNTYYGDGSPIEPETLDSIRSAYQQEMLAFPWQEGDILLLDNMLMAHGRAPFKGARKIVVGMSELYSAIAP
jgi:alpha-ketoglutarate-dependent taurine dioxygenase